MTDETQPAQLWWIPGQTMLSLEAKDLRTALLTISKPIYILDQNQKTGSAVTGTAVVKTGWQPSASALPLKAHVPALPLERLGNPAFKRRHGLVYPYIAGAMANGIASSDMVQAMAEQGMMGVFGAAGLTIDRVEQAVVLLKEALGEKPFGFNLIHSPTDPDLEMLLVGLYLNHGIRRISAAAFMRMTLPLVYYRVKGLHLNPAGEVTPLNQIIAKVSRVEVARQFFSPPPEKLVSALVRQDLISEQEARLSQYIPMAQDLTAEADSGGHTDNRPAMTLLPTMIALKEDFSEHYNYAEPLCVGLAGGIATPESAAAAFQMGADYILTGSINQSCVEAGTSREVKDLLCQAEQADVAMAPAADMFELGGRVQVLKRGTLFPVKAEKLYRYYKNYERFDQIPAPARKEIEDKILQAGFDETWNRTREFFLQRNMAEVRRADADPKHKMALVFRSYLGLSSKWPLTAVPGRQMDYQIWCGPSMGAFNQWVKGSFLEAPENRKVSEIGLNLLFGAAVCIRAAWLRNQGMVLPPAIARIRPLEKKQLLAWIHGTELRQNN
ncbi:MAG: PfaD family polyunsaturated fatty acid/polyketide biosynthesis protein [Pseudomonadota bacterium]